MPPSDKARVIFIGNIPYGLTEEQIIHIFSQAGQVLNFRLVYDKDTGRPKGFGFAEFADADAAASAVRNLADYEVMGRKLRVDYTNDGGSGGDNPPQAATSTAINGPEAGAMGQPSALPPLPQGAELPPGVTCPDAISRTLNTLPAPQLLDILSSMKGVVTSEPGKATELLSKAPQLSYAIFQSLLLLGLVDTSILASVVSQSQAPQPQAQQPPPQMPSQFQNAYPPQYPPQLQNMNPMTPPVHSQYPPPPAAAQPPMPDREALKQRVMALTPQALDAMPPEARQQMLNLRQQIMAGAI